MKDSISNKLRLRRQNSDLPSVEDFGFGSEASEAGQHFGGLSLPDAYLRFLESPSYYQEDFMWMLPKVFEYYFPVVDLYLREVTVQSEWQDGCEAWILGCCVCSQFKWRNGDKPPAYVVREIASLSEFVKNHLAHYSCFEEERSRILDEWKLVDVEVALFWRERADSPMPDIVSGIAHGNPAPLRAFLASGGDPNAHYRDRCLLIWSAQESNAECVRLLLAAGAKTQEIGATQHFPLHQAAKAGSLEIVKLLIAGGADVNQCTSAGTALVMAMVYEHADIAHYLIEAGADPRLGHDYFATMVDLLQGSDSNA